LWGGSPAWLTFRGLADAFHVSAAFVEKDHILKAAPRLSIPVRISNESDETLAGNLTLTIRTDFGDTILMRSEPVKSGKRSEKTIRFGLDGAAPGFYLCRAAFESPMYSTLHRFGFGVDPERIVSPADAPPDFDDYWARAKKELAAVAPQFRVIRKDSLCTEKRDVFLVEMRSLQNVLVRGWYSVPKKPGRYPVFLHVQGYSSNMQPASMVQEDDFASFGLNVRGHGNSQDDVNPGFPGYLQDHVLDPECYIYRGAYMDCLRALDFLFTRPEIDTTRIVVEGSSQGGALSFATAALAGGRIRLCVPGVPFLSDFRHYFKVANWPGNEFVQFVQSHPGVTWDKVFATLAYIDIKNLAPKIQAPLFMSVGLLDETCPPHINFAAYNQVKSPKRFMAYPYSGHGLPGDNYTARMAWVRAQLGMK
jgi:cephalosporin-C deacetylase